jgi:hypothetical protein
LSPHSQVLSPTQITYSKKIPKKSSEAASQYQHKNRVLHYKPKPSRPATAGPNLIPRRKEVVTYQKSDAFNLLEQEKKTASNYTK